MKINTSLIATFCVAQSLAFAAIADARTQLPEYIRYGEAVANISICVDATQAGRKAQTDFEEATMKLFENWMQLRRALAGSASANGAIDAFLGGLKEVELEGCNPSMLKADYQYSVSFREDYNHMVQEWKRLLVD